MQDAGFKVSQPFRPEGLPVPGDVLLDTLDGFGVKAQVVERQDLIVQRLN